MALIQSLRIYGQRTVGKKDEEEVIGVRLDLECFLAMVLSILIVRLGTPQLSIVRKSTSFDISALQVLQATCHLV